MWLFICWAQIRLSKANLQTALASDELLNHPNKSKFMLVAPSTQDHDSSGFNTLFSLASHYSYSTAACGDRKQH